MLVTHCLKGRTSNWAESEIQWRLAGFAENRMFLILLRKKLLEVSKLANNGVT